MTIFGQSLTLGPVLYAMPVTGAFEFTLMAGGYQSQPQGQTQTQRLPLWEWKLSYPEKTAGPASASPGQTPTCRWSERSQARDRTLLANLLQRSRQPLHGRWDPGSLFAVKKRNREFGITSRFRFWLDARSISPGAGAPYAQDGGLRSSRTRSHPARFAPAS